MQSLLRH